MKPLSFMLIAGEASGDLLAAELVGALRERVLKECSEPTQDLQPLRTELAPHFCGAGGPQMARAGVKLGFDMTQHAVIGFAEVLRNVLKFRQLFYRLFRLAVDQQPDVIIGVDYGGFNLRFGKAIKQHVRRHWKEFTPWNPRIVQFVSPQVWASRPGRAWTLAENCDLLLSIFPFEREWYAKRVPQLRVEFVGHPVVERFALLGTRSIASQESATEEEDGDAVERVPTVLLLPGSRTDEVRRHWPGVTSAFELLRCELPALRGKAVLPGDSLAQLAKSLGVPTGVEIQVGGLTAALAEADLAISKSGTIAMECAMFGVPAVVFYKTSWPTYLAGKQLASVPYLAMPNLLAGEEVYPEFVQHAATPENIARAAIALLRDDARRQSVRMKLKQVVASLGSPGAAGRAANAIMSLLR